MEVFHLHYYGINLFIGVSEVEPNQDYVYAYEIDVYNKDGYDIVMFDPGLGVFKAKADKDCLLGALKHNGYFEKTFKMYPIELDGEVKLPVTVQYGDKLYNAVTNHEPVPGIYYATKVCDGTNQSIHELLNTGWETNDYELDSYLIQA